MDTTPDGPKLFKAHLDPAAHQDIPGEIEISKIISPPPPPVDSSSATSDEVEDWGVQIATKLDADGYHPVVIVGTSSAGKSCLLCSLFAYLRSDSDLEIGIHLTDPLLDRRSTYGELVADSSESFFHRGVQEFIAGTAQPTTETRVPFFIPVVVRPKNGPEMKFAFLESRGEWYQPKRSTSAFFQQLKGEVEAVLRHFQRGVSMIYVAPYSLTQESVESGLAMVGAMNAYEACRIARRDDTHMMLVTKWDAYKKGKLDLKEVLINTKSDVEEYVNTHYKNAFAVFKGLALGHSQINLMQYCSGLIAGRQVVKPSEEIRPMVHRYPRSLWNWLYANATRTSREVGQSLQLIPDPPKPTKSLWERFDEYVTRLTG